MLAVLLYTGCDCYGDLRWSERNGDLDKWWRYARGLRGAISKLTLAEHEHFGGSRDGEDFVYSGLANVRLSADATAGSFFNVPTFTSTSTKLSVAEKFMGDQGLLIKIRRPDVPIFDAADVSWISVRGPKKWGNSCFS